MKSNFFKVVFSLLLALRPVQAMDEPNIEKHKLKQKTSYIGPSIIEDIPDEILLNILRFLDISDLGKTAQVSPQFKKNSEDSALWRHLGQKHYGDFLSEAALRENPKQKVIRHYLSVIVNATENLEGIERLVSHYQLNVYAPFKRHIEQNFLVNLVTDLLHFEEFIAQGNKELIERKIEGLSYGKYGYEKDWKAAREFIDSLVKKDNLLGIKKKAFMVGGSGSINSCIGYERDPQMQEELDQRLIKKGDLEFTYMKVVDLYEQSWNKLAKQSSIKLNEQLVEKGYLAAIKRKIEGLSCGIYGYEKDPVAATELNELLIEQGDSEAIERKIVALSDAGTYPLPFRGYSNMCWSVDVPAYGYEKDPVTAKDLNESFVERGDPEAIERKIRSLLGIATGKFSNREGYFTVKLTYGYKQDFEVARELNEQLVEKGDLVAIERKIEGLSRGIYGYEEDPIATREFNDLLVERGDPKAIERKIIALSNAGEYPLSFHSATVPSYGYELDPISAKEFNDLLVEQGNIEAIERKLRSLLGIAEGVYSTVDVSFTVKLNLTYGYEKDPLAAKEFIESLIFSDFPVVRATGKYIKAFAMKYGIQDLDYEKDREKALIFIRDHNIPY